MHYWFHKICKSSGVKYIVDSGALIGFNRYGTYLEFDGDIDVIMKYEDF